MFDLKSPCKDCIFWKDGRFKGLGTARRQEIADSLLSDQSFPCHKTTRHDEDGEYYHHDKEQHCAGATLVLMHMEMPNQMMRIAGRIGAFDPDKLDWEADVYEDLDDWVAAGEEWDREHYQRGG